MKLDETGADGFIPARTVGDDYYRYHEARHALIGDHTGESYRLGDRVTVKLVEAAPVAGALRFELLSEGRYENVPKRTRARRRVRPKSKLQGRNVEETMTDIAERLTKVERDQSHPNLKPRDAATLIIVDRSGARAEGAARQAPCGPEIHGRQAGVSGRPHGAGRPENAGRERPRRRMPARG